jgi:hypothetical protein
MWRGVYYALLAAVGVAAASTPYVSEVSFDAIVGFALLPLSIYLVMFLVWLARLWPASPFEPLRERWQATSVNVLDRTALFVASNLFFTWLPPIKATFPSANGFWADPFLADLDRSLFGQDPWKISHVFFGPVTPAIDYLYNLWVICIVVASLGVALFAGERRMSRYFLGLAISWTVLGIIVAAALASAGPIFGPDLGYGFHELRARLEESAPLTMFGYEILWTTYTTGELRIGGGISAAPSIHCALTFVFMFASFRSRWFIPATVYAVFIWLGSVHLGWHYFVDGLFSLIGVAIFWPLVVKLTSVAELRPRKPTSLPSL